MLFTLRSVSSNSLSLSCQLKFASGRWVNKPSRCANNVDIFPVWLERRWKRGGHDYHKIRSRTRSWSLWRGEVQLHDGQCTKFECTNWWTLKGNELRRNNLCDLMSLLYLVSCIWWSVHNETFRVLANIFFNGWYYRGGTFFKFLSNFSVQFTFPLIYFSPFSGKNYLPVFFSSLSLSLRMLSVEIKMATIQTSLEA